MHCAPCAAPMSRSMWRNRRKRCRGGEVASTGVAIRSRRAVGRYLAKRNMDYLYRARNTWRPADRPLGLSHLTSTRAVTRDTASPVGDWPSGDTTLTLFGVPVELLVRPVVAIMHVQRLRVGVDVGALGAVRRAQRPRVVGANVIAGVPTDPVEHLVGAGVAAAPVQVVVASVPVQAERRGLVADARARVEVCRRGEVEGSMWPRCVARL